MPKQPRRGKQPVDQTPAGSSMPKRLRRTPSTLPPTDAQNVESIVDKVVPKVVAALKGTSQVDTIPVAISSTPDASGDYLYCSNIHMLKPHTSNVGCSVPAAIRQNGEWGMYRVGTLTV